MITIYLIIILVHILCIAAQTYWMLSKNRALPYLWYIAWIIFSILCMTNAVIQINKISETKGVAKEITL